MSENTTATYRTVEQVKRANKAAGLHFFDADTLRFFSSRILDGMYGGRYFITSERFDMDSPRLYTIREAHADGSVDTVGEFQAYRSADAARRAARRLIED